MLPAPRVIAIDDEKKDLDGLVRGLNRRGTACLPVLFPSLENVPPCPHVQVIFTDLHLTQGNPGNHTQDFSTIGGLIEETIKPSGPYIIILWTKYPMKANGLHKFLKRRLKNVTRPFAVQSLDKQNYLNQKNEIKNINKLVRDINQIVAAQPQVGSLLNWGERVLGAAVDTMSSIMELAESATTNVIPNQEIGRLLRGMAVKAVGEKHVEKDRFRAMNEALFPILGDRIASMRSKDSDKNIKKLWRTAFLQGFNSNLSQSEAAKLDTLLHFAFSDDDGSSAERGAVIALPQELSGHAFRQAFGLKMKDAKEKQFRCKKSNTNTWVLVQTQAACDYAQKQPGPLPFHLGLIIPESRIDRSGKPPGALWFSPFFRFHNRVHRLHVNARFSVSLPNDKAAKQQPLFRLREQLLNDLIYQLHGYGARPGIISFGEMRM